MSSRHARRGRGALPPLAVQRLETRDVPTFYGNQVFPLDNPWNQVVSAAPVAADSSAIVNQIVSRHGGSAPALHPDFGNPTTDGALYGIPINVVDSSVPKVTVTIPSFGYASESDNVQVPIPANAVIEGDGPTGPAPPSSRGDSHLLVYDKTANVLYELYQAVRPTETSYPYGGSHPTGQWGAYQISYWNLNTDSFRTVGETSADAAGLPIMPGLVRPDEALPTSAGGQGAIKHAIRMTVQQTLDAFVYPASHEASSLTAGNLPRMGERFRLKSSFVIPSTWSPEAKAIAQAMKDYGLIVADNGSDMYFSGEPSDQWNMDSVLQVQQIHATDLEVVDLTPAVTGLSVTSGPTGGGTAVTITGRDFSGAAGQLHVLFGTTPASAVTVVSDTQVVATAPAHAAGAVDVRVQSGTTKTDISGQPVFFGYGTSPVVTADQFTYTATSPPPPPANTPPTISSVTNKTVPVGQSTGWITFTVGDAQTPAGSLAVSGSSANTTLVPSTGIVFGGSGANRTVTVTPAAGKSGSAVITLTVTDAGGLTATDAFTLTVTVPPPPPPPVPPTRQPYAVGTDAGQVATVTMYNPDGTVRFTATPFGTAYTGGVRVAVGDVTGDGVPDVVVGTNGGTAAQVKIINGATGAVLSQQLFSGTGYTGPVSVAVGDATGDGVADIAIGSDQGGPRVQMIAGGAYTVLADFVAGPAPMGTFLGKTQVSLGDINHDRKADLEVTAVYSSGTAVYGYDGKYFQAGVLPAKAFTRFVLTGAEFTGGAFPAVLDVNGDGYGDLVLGSGPGGTGHVTVYSGKQLIISSATLTVLADFMPNGVNAAQGVRVTTRDVNGDGIPDILTSSGELVTAFDGKTVPATGQPTVLWSYDPYPNTPGQVWIG